MRAPLIAGLVVVAAVGGACGGDSSDESSQREAAAVGRGTGDVLPRTLAVSLAQEGMVAGRVLSRAVSSLEVRFAGGRKDRVPLDGRRSFAYAAPPDEQATELRALDRRGGLIESVPLPSSAPEAERAAGPMASRSRGAASCRIGAAPSVRQPPVEGEGVESLTPKLVLGCGTLASGQRFELIGYRIGPRGDGRGAFCIDTVDVPRGTASGCGTTNGADGIAVQSTSHTRGHPARVAGATTRRAQTVLVRYLRGGRHGTRKAKLVRMPRRVLRRLGVGRPFGYWIAELPSGARVATAEARDGAGHRIALTSSRAAGLAP